MGCGKSRNSTSPPPSRRPAAGAVKFKWPKGERIVQDMDMKQTMELSIPGQPAPIKQDVTIARNTG